MPKLIAALAATITLAVVPSDIIAAGDCTRHRKRRLIKRSQT